jgi:hypothetical protein
MYAISTAENVSAPVAFFTIRSMLQINGRAIFQKERVDKGHQENRQRLSRSVQETGSFGWNRESSYNEGNDGRVWEVRAARFTGFRRFRSDK